MYKTIILAFLTLFTGIKCTTCIIPSSNGTEDDSPAISKALATCAKNATIVFSEGVDYNIYTPIRATNLSNVTILMQGNLHLPQNVTQIQ